MICSGLILTYLLVHVQLPEDFGGVKEMLVLKYPAILDQYSLLNKMSSPICLQLSKDSPSGQYSLLSIERQ